MRSCLPLGLLPSQPLAVGVRRRFVSVDCQEYRIGVNAEAAMRNWQDAQIDVVFVRRVDAQ